MNPEQLLNEAGDAIANRPCNGNVSCCLGFEKGKVLCLPTHHNHPTFTPIVQLTAKEMNQGMSHKRWSEISTILYHFYKKRS